LSIHTVDPELCAELAALGTATIYEASGRDGLIDLPLIQIIPGSRVAGPARTVQCERGDNRAVHEGVAHCRAGDILVLTMPDAYPVALIGELLVTQARRRGAAGLLVDGAARDIDDLRELGLPVWTRWVSVRGATKDQRGSIDVPIVLGGSRIAPHDMIVMDSDGAVVISAAKLDHVVEATRIRRTKEQRLRTQYADGTLSYDLYGMRTADQQAARA
jgi:4-hydroxy-4-methyl-2-oxoglutarate aldolase